MRVPSLLFVTMLLALGTSAAAAEPKPVRIMPLGDSITQGNTQQDSYRRPLWHLLREAGYSVNFIGSEAGNFTGQAPNPDFDMENEGHYGWKITDVLPKLDGWLQAHVPDVVLLHLGTNDNGHSKPDEILANLEQVIVKIRAANPKATVVLAQVMTAWGDLVEVNRRIPELAKKLSTKDSPVIVVDQSAGFDVRAGFDTVDGCHPNASGEAKMAKCWFEALTTVLPKPKSAAKTDGKQKPAGKDKPGKTKPAAPKP